MSRRVWVAAGLVALAGTAYVVARPSGTVGPVGPVHLPVLEVAALRDSGQVVSAHWLGRPVLVNLWASWCGPCVDELPLLEQFSDNNPQLRVVGIAVRDTAERAAVFADKAGVSYELGVDSGDSVARQFGLAGLPGTYLFGSDGVLVWGKAGQIDGSDLAAVRSLAQADASGVADPETSTLVHDRFGGADLAPATLNRG